MAARLGLPLGIDSAKLKQTSDKTETQQVLGLFPSEFASLIFVPHTDRKNPSFHVLSQLEASQRDVTYVTSRHVTGF